MRPFLLIFKHCAKLEFFLEPKGYFKYDMCKLEHSFLTSLTLFDSFGLDEGGDLEGVISKPQISVSKEETSFSLV